MKKTMKRIKAAARGVVQAAASAVALCLLSVGLAPQAQAEYCEHCITFSADKSFGIRMVKGPGTVSKTTPTVALEYSTDQVNWKTFNPDTDYKAGADNRLYLRGKDNTTFASSVSLTYSNVFTNTSDSAATAIACSGNIETLLDYRKVAAGQHPSMGDYAFCNLFSGFAALTAAPKLPATTLTLSCYTRMFKGCTSLTTAQDLPATTLAISCYSSMFEDCTSLTTAPNLLVTTLALSCYNAMFKNCTSLMAAPDLPAKTLALNCYNSMFNGCTSLTAAPNLPATTLTSSCYDSMFSGCTSLTAAPNLPATTLASSCYSSMFSGCTSLTTLPVLNVHTVTNWSCFKMFFACSNLVVNTEGPGVEWSIPSDVVVPSTAGFSTKYYWASNMFANTSGTITNSFVVTPGKKYYIASAPVALNVTAVEGATFQAYTNGAPVDVPCTIDYLTQVSVVYTADEGYMFPDGLSTFTTNFTANAAAMTITLTDDQKPKPLPPIKFDVAAPEGAKAAVYSNAVEAANLVPAGGTVLSNSIAYVVYTVTEEGKYFENGETEVINTLDTANDPAKDKSAYVPTKTGTPKVQLGVVAQRYPWNGMLDVQYKTPYANAAKVVSFYANGTKIGETQGTGGQSATVSIDLNTAADGAFKGKALKGVKITTEIE